MQTIRNLIFVMTLTGLWHGAAWPYIVFGLIQGVWLSLYMISRDWLKTQPGLSSALSSPAGTVVRIATTFIVFTLTLIVFRSPSLGSAWTMFTSMLTPHPGQGLPLHPSSYNTLVAIFAVGFALASWDGWRRWWFILPSPLRGMANAMILTLALLLTPDSGRTFIYFQF